MCWFGLLDKGLYMGCAPREELEDRDKTVPRSEQNWTLWGCVWEGLREFKDTHTLTHTCEMRDLTSPSGSDLGGHTVPHIVYAGKTLKPCLCAHFRRRDVQIKRNYWISMPCQHLNVKVICHCCSQWTWLMILMLKWLRLDVSESLCLRLCISFCGFMLRRQII